MSQKNIMLSEYTVTSLYLFSSITPAKISAYSESLLAAEALMEPSGGGLKDFFILFYNVFISKTCILPLEHAQNRFPCAMLQPNARSTSRYTILYNFPFVSYT